MPRPRSLNTTVQCIRLPTDLHARLQLHLASEAEGRVPYGSTTEFYSSRIREFFEHKRVDLAPLCGCEPGMFYISGDEASIRVLMELFERKMV